MLSGALQLDLAARHIIRHVAFTQTVVSLIKRVDEAAR
jgi:hypothetical protein